MNATQYGVVLDHPDMKKVTLQPDVRFLSDAKSQLHMDVYQPPGLKPHEKRPAIVFLNAIGDEPGQDKVKSWGIYATWPRLIAANGYIGISMETDGNRIQESIQGIFDFLVKNGAQYGIDAERLGVYAASANVQESVTYLMGEKAYKGIKAAVLYYGWPPAGPYREDLPVLAVVAQSDAHPGTFDHLWKDVLVNHAPWTLKMATGLPHAFDAFDDSDNSRRVIQETIAFWKNYLEPVPAPSWKPSIAREIIAYHYWGKPEKTLPLLERLVADYPKDTEALSYYAQELMRIEKMPEAEVVYQKILQLEPNNVNQMMNYSGLLYRQNKTAEAEKYIAMAINSGKMDANAYSRLGFLLLVAGKDLESAKYYETAVAMRPAGLDYYNLGCAYSKSKNPDKAFPALEKAIELGYNSRNQFENDGDLAPLQSDPRFKAMIDKTK